MQTLECNGNSDLAPFAEFSLTLAQSTKRNTHPSCIPLFWALQDRCDVESLHRMKICHFWLYQNLFMIKKIAISWPFLNKLTSRSRQETTAREELPQMLLCTTKGMLFKISTMPFQAFKQTRKLQTGFLIPFHDWIFNNINFPFAYENEDHTHVILHLFLLFWTSYYLALKLLKSLLPFCCCNGFVKQMLILP